MESPNLLPGQILSPTGQVLNQAVVVSTANPTPSYIQYPSGTTFVNFAQMAGLRVEKNQITIVDAERNKTAINSNTMLDTIMPEGQVSVIVAPLSIEGAK